MFYYLITLSVLVFIFIFEHAQIGLIAALTDIMFLDCFANSAAGFVSVGAIVIFAIS